MSEMLNKLKDIVESNAECREEIIRLTCYWANKILVHNQDVFRWSLEVITHREFVEHFSTLIDFDQIDSGVVKLTRRSFGPEILSAMNDLRLFKKKRYQLPRDVETYLDIIKFFSNKIDERECDSEISKFHYGNLENKHLAHVICNRDSYSIIQSRENGPYIIPNQLIEKMKRKLFNHLKKKALDDPDNLIEFLRIKGFDAPEWVVENLINTSGKQSTYTYEHELTDIYHANTTRLDEIHVPNNIGGDPRQSIAGMHSWIIGIDEGHSTPPLGESDFTSTEEGPLAPILNIIPDIVTQVRNLENNNHEEYIYMRSLATVFNAVETSNIPITSEVADIIFHAVDDHIRFRSRGPSTLRQREFNKLAIAIDRRKLSKPIFCAMFIGFNNNQSRITEQDLLHMVNVSDLYALEYSIEDVRDIVRLVTTYVRRLEAISRVRRSHSIDIQGLLENIQRQPNDPDAPDITNPFSILTDNGLKSNMKSLANEIKEVDNKMILIKATAIRIKEIGGINKMMDDYDAEINTITEKYLQKITG